MVRRLSNSAADQPERTRTVAVPSLVHRSTLETLGLTSFHLSARARYTRVIAGVTSHPTATHLVQVPVWVDDAWLGIRQQVAALQLVRPDAVASHATAAILFGWALPRRLQRGSRIHVATTTRRIRRTDVFAHCLTDLTSVECAGVRLTDPCQTLRDIAGMLSEVELHELLEGVCGTWHGPPSSTPEELLDRVPSWPRFRGSAQLLRVLPRVRSGVGSPQETQLRRTIMLDGLPEPRVAHPVTIAGITFHPDLSYPRLGIAIEYEGGHHRTDSRQWDSDIRREGLFRDVGWAYFRVTRSTHVREFLDRLAREHTRRSAPT